MEEGGSSAAADCISGIGLSDTIDGSNSASEKRSLFYPAPEPSTSKLRRRTSAPELTQPSSASSDSEASFELPSKRKGKASKKAVKPRKRGRGGSFASRTTEEALGWHNKEEDDQTPEPLRFMPARVPGSQGQRVTPLHHGLPFSFSDYFLALPWFIQSLPTQTQMP
ncbi:hypothetical protein F7725_017573 [Dissostichus mawsoni]|uniref:Uncharacterized protein n=1 Tax=Dissostichus mawsoni TaxID=36200 RepID=A0A7J5Z5H4_DISMA|nr:hypothetical protein F7725_017573 [Dissostichus mawsoni]